MNLSNATPAQREAITTDHDRILVVAGPGSGKTATTVERINQFLRRGDNPKAIAAISFTNAAANELGRRLPKSITGVTLTDSRPLDPKDVETKTIELGFIGTLHSFALRMLKVHGGPFGYGERTALIAPDSAADLMASKASSLSCRTSVEKLLKFKAEKGRPPRGGRLTLDETVVAMYLDELREAGVVDYDVLLHEFREMLTSPDPRALSAQQSLAGAFEHLFVDEAQDSTPTQWAIYRALPIDNKFYVGDPDQCQPAGTMVRMADGSGSKAIQDLKKGDAILSYDRHSKAIIRNGTVGAVSSRPYEGDLYTISANGKTTRTTANHLWLIRWPEFRDRVTNYCTYLMRKGDHFRIGTSKFFRAFDGKGHGTIGVTQRLNQERGNSIWVLRVHETSSEALVYEHILAATYGLPTVCFKEAGHAYSQADIDSIFSSVPDQIRKAMRCLSDHGRRLEYPLFDRSWKETRRTVQEIRACNLLSEIMSVPVAEDVFHYRKRGGKWSPIKVSRGSFSGAVYSLDVPRYHKYIADGIVTCNCLYEWNGARVREMIEESAKASTLVVKLEENFRSCGPVCSAAQRLIERNVNRVPKVTRPAAPKDGVVEVLGEFENEGEEIAVVARKIKGLRALYEKVPDGQFQINEIAVLARTNAIAAGFRLSLPAMGVPVVEQKRYDLPKDWLFARSLIELLVYPDNDSLAYFHLVARGLQRGLTNAAARKVAQKYRVEANAQGKTINGLLFNMTPVERPETALAALTGAGVSREAHMIAVEKWRELPSGATMADFAIALANVVEYVKEGTGDGVHVSTIHGAKGKEFDVVFIVGLEDETIPGRAADDPGQLEGERRCLYVAMTRARTQLYLSSVKSRVTPWRAIVARKPSRFFNEIFPA